MLRCVELFIVNGLITKYCIGLILISCLYYGCQECDDCGPGQQYPYVNLMFFNMDSLVKVENTLENLEDSLQTVNNRIQEGDTTLFDTRDNLQELISLYEESRENINLGKMKIDRVYGVNGQGPLYFRDSTTRDTLTNFQFPLAMDRDQSAFEIHFQDQVNEIGFKYTRQVDQIGKDIVIRVLNIQLLESTFDSVKINCKKSSCLSNETVVDVYF